MKYTLKVLFGEIEVNQHIWENQSLDKMQENIKIFHFKTKAEKDSFLQGLNEGIGWQNYQVISI